MSAFADRIWAALVHQFPKELAQVEERIARDVIDTVLTTFPSGYVRAAAKRQSTTIPPTYEQVKNYFIIIKCDLDPQDFIDFYESKGWVVGKSKMKNWHAAASRANRVWARHGRGVSQAPKPSFMA